MFIALMVLACCLCGCGFQDWRCRKISNLWILAGILAGSIFCGSRFWRSAVPMLMAGFWMYFFRMIGAGDLKMMALICGFIGFIPGLCAIGVGAGICGASALVRIGLDPEPGTYLSERLHYFFAWFRHLLQTKKRIVYYDASRDGRKPGIPLGSYLCIGTLCYLVYGFGKGVI